MSVAETFPFDEPSPAGPDWAAIKLAYEANDLSVREISRRYGVSDTAIHKRAKAEHWLRTPVEKGFADGFAPEFSPPLQTSTRGVVQTFDDPSFRWEPENEDVIVPEQLALAVYRNHWGDVVIRQQVDMRSYQEDDRFICCNVESLPKLIAKLQRMLRDIEPENAAASTASRDSP